jgi:hypothetical protein
MCFSSTYSCAFQLEVSFHTPKPLPEPSSWTVFVIAHSPNGSTYLCLEYLCLEVEVIWSLSEVI